jgi:sterol 3beta-glucosyltransferase
MRIALLAIGSRGDVQPFVVLGRALSARGHDVVLATGHEFEPMAEEAGLKFRKIGDFGAGYADYVLGNSKVQKALRRSPSIHRMVLAAPKPTLAQLRALTDEMVSAAEGADLVVNTTLTRIGVLARPGTPWCSVALWPMNETAEWPALGAPEAPFGGRLRAAYNLVTHRFRSTLEWLMYRPLVNMSRKKFGLPKVGFRSPFREDGRTRPILYQFSPHVFSPPADWPAHAHITGYWSDNARWSQPPELQDFVESGAPPLVVTFGSAWLPCGKDLLTATVAAARETGHRLVIIGGPSLETAEKDDIFRSKTADFVWLLPKAAAVLHHGGQGTTAASVSSGVPQVIVPCYADQPLWARRMAALGVAAPPVPYPELTGSRLAQAILRATRDSSIAAKAAALADSARDEDGVEKAVDILEKYRESVS